MYPIVNLTHHHYTIIVDYGRKATWYDLSGPTLADAVEIMRDRHPRATIYATPADYAEAECFGVPVWR